MSILLSYKVLPEYRPLSSMLGGDAMGGLSRFVAADGSVRSAMSSCLPREMQAYWSSTLGSFGIGVFYLRTPVWSFFCLSYEPFIVWRFRDTLQGFIWRRSDVKTGRVLCAG